MLTPPKIRKLSLLTLEESGGKAVSQVARLLILAPVG